jgi:menaquinol-cytochrome c reductase iron-sulfur subunit
MSTSSSTKLAAKDIEMPSSNEAALTRRGFFVKMGILFNGLVATALAADRAISPILDYARALGCLPLLGATRAGQRISGRRNAASNLQESLRDADRWQDGGHGLLGAAHRRRSIPGLCVNCMHLGCPVRWFPQSGLFMCPCHGGAYYRDGSRASGPPERGLVEYPNKVENGLVTIQAGELPTPGATAADLGTRNLPWA